jgi:CRISPR-associated endonuclease/helicase Cas3
LPPDKPTKGRPSETLVAWVRRDSTWAHVALTAVRPGDLVVLPCGVGGHDGHGWTGTGGEPVVDLGGLASSGRVNGPARLRLTADVLGPLFGDATCLDVKALLESDSPDAPTILRRLRDGVSGAPYADVLLQTLERLKGARLEPVVLDSATEESAGVFRYDIVGTSTASWFDLVGDDGDLDTSQVPQEVTLAVHLRSVGARAQAHASRLGLVDDVVASVGLAGRFHDLGKAELRFQTRLRRGRRHHAEATASDADSALAKSVRQPRNIERQIARRSGWPAGLRHEAVSLVMVQSAPAEVFVGVDRLLVEHLVASHHGYARPFFPPVADALTTMATVTFDGLRFDASTRDVHPALSHADAFDRLNQTYGTWGLALLETIVRLADMSISEEGS